MALYTDIPAQRQEEAEARSERVDALRRLAKKCAESEWGLNHVAENVEERGLKLLLKALAQQRANFSRQLQAAAARLQGEPTAGAEPSEDATPVGAQRGMTDIAAAMTLSRRGREQVALSDQSDDERELLREYTDVLAMSLSDDVRRLVEGQRDAVAGTLNKLSDLHASEEPHLVARLFDSTQDADRAVAQLREEGFTPAEYQVLAVGELPVHRETPAGQRKSMMSTVVGGALSGGVVGGLAGLAYALYQWFGPGPQMAESVSPWIIFLSSLAFGALFGAVFGVFIGRNKIEDDAFVYAEGLTHGQQLVVVYPSAERVDDAERILQVYHERELGLD